MVKVIKVFRLFVISAVVVALGLLVFGFVSIPDEFSSLDSGKMSIKMIYSLQPLEQDTATRAGADKTIDVRVNLFKAIPVKNSRVKFQKRRYVVPSGEIFGLRLYTRVVVVSTDKVDTDSGMCCPAQEAGIEKGDIILSINSVTVRDHTQVAKLISESLGSSLRVVFERNGRSYETVFTPVYSSSQGKYVGGLWIRDSAAGIGTMTFFEKSTGAYGGLGHAICDVDTGKILPLSEGDVVEATVNGCTKGKAGEAGELCGSFTGLPFGELYANTASGVFGVLKNAAMEKAEIPVAVKSEVKTGKASIISTVDENGPAYYDIEIEKISPESNDNRNMVIRITDKKLLEKTGGIVQGMSGSPIIQNKKLVGAVTHVFVNEPDRGYAIFAERMIEMQDAVLNDKNESAA